MTTPLTAHAVIRCDPPTLWRITQDPASHVRWDARFTDIAYLRKPAPDAPQRFRYATRIGIGRSITGWGQTVAEREPASGTRGSALRFGSDDPMSLIRDGAGSWSYRPAACEGFTHFRTAYDYRVRFGAAGRLLDRLAFRPLMRWATRWSFDRLRLWVERGPEPETALRLWLVKLIARSALALVWVYEGLVPKLLYTTQSEIDLVARSGLYWPTPAATLAALAAGEILGGLWLLTGRAERAAAAVSLLLLTVLGTLCAIHEPGLLHHPFGGLSKNLGLIACALVVYLLSRVTPRAARATDRAAARFADAPPPSPLYPGERAGVRGSSSGTGGEPPTLTLSPEYRGEGTRQATSPSAPASPFAAALGTELDGAAPAVRDHFLHADGVRHYRGVMTRVWRRRGLGGKLATPALWLARFAHTLFPDTGEDVPFELEHAVERGPDGRPVVRFVRTFGFPAGARRFAASLTFDPARNCLRDRLGRGGVLEVELHPRVASGELRLRSGRQFLRLGALRLPVPRLLSGAAHVREWQTPDGRLAIEVVISNPLLGDFFGYEGTFSETPAGSEEASASGKDANGQAEELRRISRPFSIAPPELAAARGMPHAQTDERPPARKAPAPAHRQWRGNLPTSPTSHNSRATGRVTWPTRAALALVAFAGTAAYAASFTLAGAGPAVGVAAGPDGVRAAAAVALAAGLSWPLFGAALLCLTRARAGAWEWADACLRTMAWGVAVLSVGAAGNVVLAASGALVPGRGFVICHAALLLAGNALMAVAFVPRAARLGLRPRAALGAWVVALDAPFAALLVLFATSFNKTGVL